MAAVKGEAVYDDYQRLDVSNHLDQRPIRQVQSQHPRSFWNGFQRPAGIMAIAVLIR